MRAQSCLTLDSMDCSPPGSSVHGISQARILEWVAITSSRGSSLCSAQTHVSCIGRWILYHWATWEAQTSFLLCCCQLLNGVWLFATPWTAAHQASLFFTISWTLWKLMSIESVMPSNHLILCHPLLFLSSIFPSFRVFSNQLALRIRWPRYWTSFYPNFVN